MPKRIQLPDGNIGEFPDSMSNEQIEGVLQKQFPKTPAPKPGFWDSLKTDSVTQGTSHQMPHNAAEVGREAVRGGANIGAGALNTLSHPIDTVEVMLAQE